MRSLGLSVPHGSVAMAIVGLNIIFYAIASLASANSTGGTLMGAMFNPNIGTLYNMGGLEAGSVVSGQIWRLWTYQFLHGGLIHIGFNLYALLSLGPATEDVYGPSKTAVLYWVTGVFAGLASFGMKLATYFGTHGQGQMGITIGASGAIFGLIGLLIGHAIRRGGSEGAYLRSFLTRWAIYGLVMGFMLGADNSAHIGGLASGFVLGLVVRDGEAAEGPPAVFWRLAAFGVAGLTIYGFVAAALAPHAG
jgi:rhomboid protease GluP